MATGDKLYIGGGGNESFDTYYSINIAVDTSESSYPLEFTSSSVKFISNDDESNDLHVSFNNKGFGSSIGKDAYIVLKPNEVLNDFPIKATSVTFRRMSGNGVVRAVFV